MNKNIFTILTLSASLAVALIEFGNQQRLVVLIFYGAINPLMFLTPYLLFKFNQRTNTLLNEHWFYYYDRIVFPMIVFNAFGSLWFHSLGFQYDRFLHFTIGALVLPLSILLFFWLRPTVNTEKLLKTSVLLSLIGIFGFEGFQFSLDYIFGTQLFYDTIQYIAIDFFEDIIFGSLGILLSAYLIKNRFRFIENISLAG